MNRPWHIFALARGDFAIERVRNGVRQRWWLCATRTEANAELLAAKTLAPGFTPIGKGIHK